MIDLLWNVLREDEAQDIAEYAVMLGVVPLSREILFNFRVADNPGVAYCGRFLQGVIQHRVGLTSSAEFRPYDLRLETRSASVCAELSPCSRVVIRSRQR